ncbi:DUF5693 family protein [Jeotgalibacillus marinus]|uniref:DUF5693 family protein n=1 Tax=Jeotgalibacillus marinus TaxID=86667 RepID=A0ABV3Q4M3_9BACL
MKKALTGILLLALILTMPSVYQRIHVEEANKIYELILPNYVIDEWMVNDPSITQDQVYNDLSEAGIQSISVEPDTLRTLERRGEITVISSSRMREYIVVNQHEPLDEFFNKEGLFIRANNEYPLEETVSELFKGIRAVEIIGVDYLFIPGQQEQLSSTAIGYDEKGIESILNAGFNVIPILSNVSEEIHLNKMITDLISLKSEHVNKILFSDQELPGYPEVKKVKSVATKLNDAGFSLLSIEFEKQAGFIETAYTMDLNVIRLHSLTVLSENLSISSERIIRAVKERNIRAIFITMSNDNPKEAITELSDVITTIDGGLASSYTMGESIPFNKIEISKWQLVIGLLGSIAYFGLATSTIINRRWFTLVTISFSSLLALGYVVLEQSIILKIFALALAIIAPIFAILIDKSTNSKGYLFTSYLKAIGITFLGIWFIIVLLNGNQFILGIDSFSGVKLVYILPIAFAVIYALWGNIKALLKLEVKYWHLLFFGSVAIIAFYYITRTGNTDSVSSLELQSRQLLEQFLYVRPRTKEFLIGFPLFVIALYVTKTSAKASLFILIPAVIGFLSMVNTFTHFHIPLSISLLRSFYSIVFGFIIGLFLVYLYKWVGRGLVERLKARWQ